MLGRLHLHLWLFFPIVVYGENLILGPWDFFCCSTSNGHWENSLWALCKSNIQFLLYINEYNMQLFASVGCIGKTHPSTLQSTKLLLTSTESYCMSIHLPKGPLLFLFVKMTSQPIVADKLFTHPFIYMLQTNCI